MGIVYVLTNEAMPGLVKIGMTDENDANARIGQLYTTGVPLPFELEYACRVENPDEVERAIHTAFRPQRINDRREFFRIEPEQAIAILKLLHHPDATDATEEVKQQPQAPEVDAESLAAVERVRARRPNLDFKEMGIPSGATLQFVDGRGVTATVIGPKRVRLGDEELSLTAATQNVLRIPYSVRPAPHWTYDGKLLSEIYDETYAES